MEDSVASLVRNRISQNIADEDSSSSLFAAPHAPALPLEKLLVRFTHYWSVPTEALVMACVILDRARNSKSAPRLTLTPKTAHKALTAAVVVATKFILDDFEKHSGIAMAAGIRPQTLTSLEMELLRLVDFNVFTDSSTWNSYISELESLAPASV